MKIKLLDYTLIGILTGSFPVALTAQSAGDDNALTETEAYTCTSAECASSEGTLLKIHTSEDATAQAAKSNTSQPVLAQANSGRASVTGNFTVPLPNGGVIWATEDPALGQPELTVSATSVAAYDGQRIVQPVRFMVRSNYPAFIKYQEINVYRASDIDRTEALATIAIPVAPVSQVEWDGTLPANYRFRAGDELIYVLRAYGDNGAFDETFPNRIQLVRPEESSYARQQVRNSAWGVGQNLTEDQAETQNLLDSVFAQNALRRQTIPIYGSRVRIQGHNIPRGQSLSINGATYPVDIENKFVAEYLVPIGYHTFDIALFGGADGESRHQLNMDVTGRYFFGMGIADLTISSNDIDGNDAVFDVDNRYTDDPLSEGRLAFFIKAKTRGKYLITAQADTTEQELGDLFDDFTESYPTDVFRRLDPDLYYPTYGDDSYTYRDVDTQGRFYFRVDWDRSQALWGNYATEFVENDYAQYIRSLYGAAVAWYSLETNEWGDSISEIRGFGSQAESAPGHVEFLGTGGSLYYLKHQDILPGSDKVALEVRDRTTGRVESTIFLLRGTDYEIDELQGRIILSRALAQITRENLPTLTREMPLDGLEQRLIVDYEWVPNDFDDDNITSGGRVKQWVHENAAIGLTYVDEERAGDDFQMAGGDLTLQAAEGTYVKMEYVSTNESVAPVFYSDNGGFNFERLNGFGSQSGDARLVETRVNFKEMGWTHTPLTTGAWWRNVDNGFGASIYDLGEELEEVGFEVLGDIQPNLNLYARATEAEAGDNRFKQLQATLTWGIDDYNTLAGEIRHVDEDSYYTSGSGMLSALEYTRRIGTSLDVYGLAQGSFDEDGNYEENNLGAIGARYLFGNLSSIGAEVSSGDRGDAATVDGEYRLNPNHSFYANYVYSTDTTSGNSLFDPQRRSGWTFGQRWRISNQVSLFNESQLLKEPTQDGINHTFGLDFFPAIGWNLGFTLQSGELINIYDGEVDRRAVSLHGGRSTPVTNWVSKVEFREDSGAEDREQWITTNRVSHKINESWRVSARLNYSDTDDRYNPAAGAKFIEGNFGFAWRPWDNSRWNMLGRVTYLEDLATWEQIGGNNYDQKTEVFSFEGIYAYNQHWEFSGKLARREGQVRLGRGSGNWFDSGTSFAGIQGRYDLLNSWHGIAEYRWLSVDDGGEKDGWLLGVDYDLSDCFRVGVGYNFTDFSDDLTDFDYDHQGWYLNFVGSY